MRAKKTWSCVEIFTKHAERRARQLLADGPKGITRLRPVPPQRSRSPDIDGSRVGRHPCLVPAILFARTTSLSLGKVTLSMSILPTSRPATFSAPLGLSPRRPRAAPVVWKGCWPRCQEDAHGQRHCACGKRGHPSKEDRWNKAWKSPHARTIELWRDAPLRRYLTETGDSIGSVGH